MIIVIVGSGVGMLTWLIIQNAHNAATLRQIQHSMAALDHNELVMTKSISHISQQASQWQQQAHQDDVAALHQVKQLNQQFQSTLQELKQRFNQLSHTVSTLPTRPQTTVQEPTTKPTRHPAVGYSIYAVEPYGVVIGTPSGQFHIVRVGEVIPTLGQVKSISADQVLVGQQYVIHARQ